MSGNKTIQPAVCDPPVTLVRSSLLFWSWPVSKLVSSLEICACNYKNIYLYSRMKNKNSSVIINIWNVTKKKKRCGNRWMGSARAEGLWEELTCWVCVGQSSLIWVSELNRGSPSGPSETFRNISAHPNSTSKNSRNVIYTTISDREKVG